MNNTLKVAWMENQYLYPQHFQQQDRYVESLVYRSLQATIAYGFGFQSFTLNSTLQSEGCFGITQAQGIMPDGYPFDLPSLGNLPEPLRIPENTRDTIIALTLPRYTPGKCFLSPETTLEAPARYQLVTEEIHDYSQLKPSAEQVDCATPCFSLHLDNQSLGGYACLPIARVREVTAEGAVILDPSFIPPLIHVPDNTPPRRYLDEVIGLLNQRANTLAHRFSDAQHSAGHSALADFMLLQLVNRYEQQLRHLTKLPLLHPERLFEVLLCLASELASFTSPTKRLQLNVCYQHLALAQCFEPLMNTLHQQLGAVLEQTATQIPLEAKQFGIHVAPLGEVDKGLLNSARFVLGIRANHPTDFLRRHLPDHLKIGSVHSIRDLVNNQLSGIKPTLLPIAPREIQYSPGSVYFELDQTGEHWQRLKDSTGIALHIAGNFSELSLELWAIKL